MARGDKATYNQQEQQSYSNAQKASQQAQQNQQAAFEPAYAGYTNELANPGYTPAEQQAMTQAEMGSLGGAFAAAASRLRDRAARTGNTAGLNATEEELGREQGQQQAQALGSLQQGFANAAIQGRQNALAGESGLYRATSAANQGAMATGANLVGTQGKMAAGTNQNNFWGKVLGAGLDATAFIPGLGPAVKGALTAAGGALGKG